MGLTTTGGESGGQRRSEGFGRGQQQHSGLSSRSRPFASGRAAAGGYTALGLLLHGWPGREEEARDVYRRAIEAGDNLGGHICSPSSKPSGFCAAD